MNSPRPTSALVQLLCARDVDALSGFYDRCGGHLSEYCTALCGPERAGEAIVAALTDFLARVTVGTHDEDLDVLLVKATRSSGAARLEPREPGLPCRLIPELLAAAANGELRYGDRALAGHLEGCGRCRAMADRLLAAERSFDAAPQPGTSTRVRDLWLQRLDLATAR